MENYSLHKVDDFTKLLCNGKEKCFWWADASIKLINWHIKIDLYVSSYEVTCDLLHGPPLKRDYNCILSINSSSRELHFTGTQVNWD